MATPTKAKRRRFAVYNLPEFALPGTIFCKLIFFAPMIVDEFSLRHPDNLPRRRYSRILPLESSDPQCIQVERLFLKGWRHLNKPKPTIRAIYKILSSDQSLEVYARYKSQVQTINLLSKFNKGANEQLCFHGTKRLCLLGENNSKVFPCESSECSLCCIIQGSFDVAKCGNAHSFRRFGAGIYTTSCSSIQQHSASNSALNTNLRVLLVSRVVVGKPHNRRHNATHMNQPPTGHHSVCDVVGLPGVDLNYEETVVYRNDAIRPAYLVVYGPSTPPKPVKRIHSKAHTLLSSLFKTPVAV
ncbi:hypothetical protein BDP27DRAFT_1385423 [Rhodocollybia butyracea]|uniref:PARP n=1 Tax=Rhodocollybia butyracea TaxID=206335 RepID=A0A9P5TZS0_9AGAR|nr:hypothetical protein BDP27DRAFT_1385423 [Rhodocollybia butyracea]